MSRDALALADASTVVLTHYAARHSWISEGTDASPWFPDAGVLQSDFQRRNLVADVRGTTLPEVLDAMAGADVLLLDLVDERHGVVRFPDGSYATRSIEALGTEPLKEALGRGELIPFGSDRHFALWSYAADRLVSRLRQAGVLDRVLALSIPWATTSRSGEKPPTSMGTTSEEANERFARYYAHLRSLGVECFTVEGARADREHRWGFAPFHYEAVVYEAIVARLADA